MASTSDCDRFDVQKVVRLLSQDCTVIDNKGHVWRILDIPYAQVKAAEDQYRCGTITIEDLFVKLISSWKSKTNGSEKELRDILNQNGFKTSAGSSKIITFRMAYFTIRPKFIPKQ
jgi:hypothetical protein